MPKHVRPKLCPVEVVPAGRDDEEALFALRDPEGFGETLVMPEEMVVLAQLMDGRRTLPEIQRAFKRETGLRVSLRDVAQLVGQLSEAYLLCGRRFERHRRTEIESHLARTLRMAAHAGSAYPADAAQLRQQLEGYFTGEGGPGAIELPAQTGGTLCGIVSPHIDLVRGGPTFAWAYKQVAELSNADLYVIFGTSHNPLRERFSVSRKDFETPLGRVWTDGRFIDRLAAHLGESVAGRQTDLFRDELAQRYEHSIEFQAVFLQHVLGGRREFRIVPVLVGSFHEFIAGGTSPGVSPEIEAFVAAVRAAAEEHPGEVCYIGGADLAHVGQRFGDRWLLDERRLKAQSAEDHKLLDLVYRGDAAGFFARIARHRDRRRICGLAPIYVMLRVMGRSCGELLKYDQAVEGLGTACVSFASVAFYRQ